MTTPPSNPIPETTLEFDAFWQMLNTPQPASTGPRLQASGPSFEIDLPLPPGFEMELPSPQFGPQRNEQN